ncbi:MAG TPA: hemerythrin domain-containing protein [Kofleriaceae bacterium]|nr:hemerythrin domain-containing protein [Kofleriaceae bacterium]
MTARSTAIHELLDQHDALRLIMDGCEQLADELDGGGDCGARLVREVARLRHAFAAHVETERHVLGLGGRDLPPFPVDPDHPGPTAELRAMLSRLRAQLAAEERCLRSGAFVLLDDRA